MDVAAWLIAGWVSISVLVVLVALLAATGGRALDRGARAAVRRPAPEAARRA
jgi:hypothetical protein